MRQYYVGGGPLCMIVERGQIYASAISEEISYKSNVYTVHNFTKPVQMSHLEYISTHNFYLQATLQHLLQGAKHLQSPPLPVTFLFFLH